MFKIALIKAKVQLSVLRLLTFLLAAKFSKIALRLEIEYH
jgi:hypothetical protein